MTSEHHHVVVYSWYLPCTGRAQQQGLMSITSMLWYDQYVVVRSWYFPCIGSKAAAVTSEHHQYFMVYSWYFLCIGSAQQQCISNPSRRGVDDLEVHYSSWQITELWAWLVSRVASMTSEHHQHVVVCSWYLPCIDSAQQQRLVSIISMLWYDQHVVVYSWYSPCIGTAQQQY